MSGPEARCAGEVRRPLVGVSDWARRTQAELRSVAPFLSSVLITGPSGTGKEVIARAIHDESPRNDKPFIAVNCAAITGPLFESHMFGHLKGAFTGAAYAALGCFRAADGGTIFLDEIGDLELELQVKLLRTLQERAVMPVGSHEDVPIDVRVIAATNRELRAEVEAGRFREDLYYRLAVVALRALPLRERREDIDVLAQYLLSAQCVRHGLPFKPLAPTALERLRQHPWPGNVRELQNVLERAVMLAKGELIGHDDIVFDQPTTIRATPALPADADPSLEEVAGSLAHPGKVDGRWLSMDEFERWHIEMTLEHTGHNQSAAARLLEMDRSVLRRRMKKHGIG